jgi:hypothetical protein
VQKAALVETHSSQQQCQQQPIKISHPKALHQKNLLSSFRESFISSGKQVGGATGFREGCDTVTRETCIPTSLKVNNLEKAAVLHFAFLLSFTAGACQTQPVDH